MEILISLLAVIWLITPLPLCLYLLKQNKSNKEIQQRLIWKIDRLKDESYRSATEENRPKEKTAKQKIQDKVVVESPAKAETEIIKASQKQSSTVDPDIERLRHAAKNAQKQADFAKQKREDEKSHSPSYFDRLCELLLQIGLLPPKENRGLESGLIPWALPRIGGVLGLLASLFFAVYMGKNTVPWVRFTELLLANIAVFFAAFFLYKKDLSKIASVVEGMGLSMLYLCSVASYAAKPVKVIDNLTLGITIQVLSIIGIFAWSYFKNRKSAAHIAVIFAYISATFSAFEGFREAALFLAFFTYLASIISLKLKDWKALIYISIIGVYLPVLAFFIKDLSSLSQVPHPYSISLFIAANLSLLPFAQLRLKEVFFSITHERIFQSLNTSLAIGIAYAFYKNFHPDFVTQFYGIFTLVFCAWSLPLYFSNNKDFAFHLFFNKACLFLALYLVNTLESEIAWYSLCLQLLVLIPTVKRKATSWILLAPTGLIFYSFYLFIEELIYMPEAYSFKWFLFLSGPIIILIFIASITRVYKDKKVLFNLLILSSLIPVSWLFICLFETDWNQYELVRSLCILCLASILLSLLRCFNQRVFAIPVSLLFISANIVFLDSPYKLENLISLIALSGILIFGSQKKEWKENFSKRFHAKDILLGGIVIMSWASWLESYHALHYIHLLFPLLSICLLISSKKIRAFADLSLLPLFIYLVQSHFPKELWLFALMSLLLGIYFNASFYLQQSKEFFYFKKEYFRAICSFIICGLILLNTAESLLSDSNSCYYFIGLGICQIVLLQKAKTKLLKPDIQSLFISSYSLLLIALIPMGQYWIDYSLGGDMTHFPWTYEWLTMGSISAVSWLFIGSYSRKTTNTLDWSKQTLWLSALLFYACIIASFNFPYIQIESVLTPILAFSCILLIAAGFILKIRAYRLTGVFGLLYPIYRLFIFDIDETIYRIIAFAILSILLMAVGFVYHRNIDKIEMD